MSLARGAFGQSPEGAFIESPESARAFGTGAAGSEVLVHPSHAVTDVRAFNNGTVTIFITDTTTTGGPRFRTSFTGAQRTAFLDGLSGTGVTAAAWEQIKDTATVTPDASAGRFVRLTGPYSPAYNLTPETNQCERITISLPPSVFSPAPAGNATSEPPAMVVAQLRRFAAGGVTAAKQYPPGTTFSKCGINFGPVWGFQTTPGIFWQEWFADATWFFPSGESFTTQLAAGSPPCPAGGDVYTTNFPGVGFLSGGVFQLTAPPGLPVSGVTAVENLPFCK